MIICIHGFGGSGASSKAVIFRNELEDYKLISPSLSYIPELAIATLKEMISTFMKSEKVYLIGSSLADYFHILAVLINTSVNPKGTLHQYPGRSTNFYYNSFYKWNEKHIEDIIDFFKLDNKE